MAELRGKGSPRMPTHLVRAVVVRRFVLRGRLMILLPLVAAEVAATPLQVEQAVDSLGKTVVKVQGMEERKSLVEQRQTPNLVLPELSTQVDTPALC